MEIVAIWGAEPSVVLCVTSEALQGVLGVVSGRYLLASTLPVVRAIKTRGRETRPSFKHRDIFRNRRCYRELVYEVQWKDLEAHFAPLQRSEFVPRNTRSSLFLEAKGVMVLFGKKTARNVYSAEAVRESGNQLNAYLVSVGRAALALPRTPVPVAAAGGRKRGRPVELFPSGSVKHHKQAVRSIGLAQQQYREEHGREMADDLRVAMSSRASPAVAAVVRIVANAASPELQRELYIAMSQKAFPAMWKVLRGKDRACVSFESYHQLRDAKDTKELEPAVRWLKNYQRIVNGEALGAWSIAPEGEEVHEGVGAAGAGAALNNSRIAYCSLSKLLAWAVQTHILQGEDLTRYMVREDGTFQERLVYKLSFDTTVTGGREMFMMGVVPHTFPLGAKVQSSGNILVLCLATLSEDREVVSRAVPKLEQEVKELISHGVRVQVAQEEHIVVGVDMHVAADLKALWLALQLNNFACTLCTAGGWDDMQRYTGPGFAPRQLEPCLGVPAENVHLCALHATLRIAERLVKSAVMFAYGLDNQRRETRGRVAKLKVFMASTLKRKNFSISQRSAALEKEACAGDVLDVGGVVTNSRKGQGVNVTGVKSGLVIKVAALKGADARHIIGKQDVYTRIVEISEGKLPGRIELCRCIPPALRSLLATKLVARMQLRDLCRACRVWHVWHVFSTVLNPLLSHNGTPDRLVNAAKEGGAAAVTQEIGCIRQDALAWIDAFNKVYGQHVTPYVHIVGLHLHQLLQQSGNTIGGWSQVNHAPLTRFPHPPRARVVCHAQQGFEAAHKWVRRIYQHATSHAGGNAGGTRSALVQILQHLYRLGWAHQRHLVETKKCGKRIEGEAAGVFQLRSQLVEFLKHTRFLEVDTQFAAEYPDLDFEKYVERHCTKRFTKLQRAAHDSACDSDSPGSMSEEELPNVEEFRGLI